jgi:glycosyltransferase involved in cell wall biosynthesis
MPKVSVIMSVCNGEVYLNDCINSIIHQTYRHWEFIIINDASIDDSERIIRSYTDKRINQFVSKKHLGVAKALNIAIEKSTGDLIARMDADDVSERTRLEKQVKFFIDNPKYGLVGSYAFIIQDKHDIIIKKFPSINKDIRKVILSYNPFIHSSVMFRRQIITKLGKYNESLNGAEDYDLWLRIAAEYPVFNIPIPLVKYRINNNALSYKKMKHIEIQSQKVRINALMNYHYPFWQAIYLVKPAISLLIPQIIKQKILYG